jgi:adenylate cyclase
MAKRLQDPLTIAMAHWSLGWMLVPMGELSTARQHLEHVVSFYDIRQHRTLAYVYAQDPAVSCLVWLACALWFLGYPDQALKRVHEALALARELDHAFSLGFALGLGGMVHQLRREAQAGRELVEEVLRISTEGGFLAFQVWDAFFLGFFQTEEGTTEEGISQMREALPILDSIGWNATFSHRLAMLAEALGKSGQPQEGLAVLAEALARVKTTGERYFEAEIHRLRGELLLLRGEPDAEVEALFEQAIEITRRQEARSLELRATMSLARLWRKQGKNEEARERLAEVYGWFTEGFDTPDLRDAKALLEELG